MVATAGASLQERGRDRDEREERREKREKRRGVLPTSEPSLNPLRMCCNRAKKIHLISEKLILAVAKERFERTIAAKSAAARAGTAGVSEVV